MSTFRVVPTYDYCKISKKLQRMEQKLGRGIGMSHLGSAIGMNNFMKNTRMHYSIYVILRILP